MTLLERLTRELKANGPKTAVLGVLLLVGLYFWLPPVWRAVTGPAGAAETVAPVAESMPTPPADPSTAPTAPKSIGWADAERLRTEDDLFRSAQPAEVAANAFVFDGGFLPIDVEFGEEDPETKAALADAARTAETRNQEAAAAAEDTRPPLTLKSTLVGSNRRVAVINGRAYPEGATIAAAGRIWTLMNVEPRRVLLNGDGGTLELTIDPFASARAAAVERTLSE